MTAPVEENSQALYQEPSFYGEHNKPTDNLGLLRVKHGLTEEQINQLIQFANHDDLVKKHSSDSRRFKDREAFNKWLGKGRSIYAMEAHDGRLLGIVWFGKSIFPEAKLKPEFKDLDTDYYGITFALRIYGEARGQKIAKKLTAAAFTAYLKSEDYKEAGGNGFWLETSQDNKAGVKTYLPLFTQVSDANENGRIIMILDPRKVNLNQDNS